VRRLRDVRLPPLAWVALIAAVTGLLRLAVALRVQTLLYYPDEYVTAALSRAIGDGDFGQIRGGTLQASFTAYFVPLLHAPLWLIDDVAVAYRLAQAAGVVAFSAAAFPAYALARRLGISANGGIVAALLALLLPAGGFTATLLGEPYAYPLFLTAALVAVEAIAHPTVARHLAAIGLSGLLCLVGGLQFAFFGLAYAGAWFVAGAWTTRAVVRRLAAVVVAGAALFLALAASGRDLDFFLTTIAQPQYPPGDVGSWLGVNAFVLALAAGWLVVPGAVVGLWTLARRREPRPRAFAFLAALVIGGTLFEAALWSANGHGVYERFTFYGAPLLALAFVWNAENPQRGRAAYAAVAYGIAAAALLLPATDALLVADDDHSPALLGLSVLTLGERVGPIVWAPALAVLLVGVAMVGARSARAVAAVAVAFSALLSLGASIEYVRRADDPLPPPRVTTPPGSAMLAWEGTNLFFLQETLFWNPAITRVVVLEPGGAPDGLPLTQARLEPGGRLVDSNGEPVEGPFVVGPDTFAVSDSAAGQARTRLVALVEIPPVLVFGGDRPFGYLGLAGRIFISPTVRASAVTFVVRSDSGSETLAFRCEGPAARTVDVGTRPSSISLTSARTAVRVCHYRVSQGKVVFGGGPRRTARVLIRFGPV
jgi:hypothetical protein